MDLHRSCQLFVIAACFGYISCCSVDKIKECLVPVKDYLANSNMGNANKGLFQTSIEHYLLTLEDIHIKFIHISSLNTILKRLDIVFVNPKKLGSVCSKLATAESCLKNLKVFCDEEERDEMEGLENMFNFMCLDEYQKVYRKHFRCLTSEQLTETRKSIDEQLERKLNSFAQPPPDVNHTSDFMSGVERNEETQKYDLHKDGIPLWQPDSDTDSLDELTRLEENQALTRQVCSAVDNALRGYKEEVASHCNNTAAEWAYKLRHTLVQILLITLQCEYEESYFHPRSLLNETGCFACNNGFQCIDRSNTCDGIQDCSDGSDEDNCSSQAATIFSVIIGLAVTTVVVIVIVVCVVKCREEAVFGHGLKRTDSSSTEMMSITQQEMSLGNSTPPVINGKSFMYKSLPDNNNDSAAANA